MRIAIVGSRDYPYPERVRAFVEQLPSHAVAVSGGARGVDRLAIHAAQTRGLSVEVFEADWATGRGAGMARNAEMLATCQAAMLFWDGRSPGTRHAIETCVRLVASGQMSKFKVRGIL